MSRDVVFEDKVFPFKQSSHVPSFPLNSFFPSNTTFPSSDENDNSHSISSSPAPPVPLSSIPYMPPSPVPRVSPSHVPPRRSSRISTKPAWFQDFITPSSTTTSATSSPLYPLSKPDDMAAFPKEYIAFLANVCAHSEPTSYPQACTNKFWVEAIKKNLGL